MTPPIDDPATLRRILANTEALLLDFDGPICSVFSGIPAPVVADQLRSVLAEGGVTDLPADVRAATDPFNVLFYAAKLGPDEARYVEAAFRAHEVEAVQTAEPTPGAHDLICALTASGQPVAVVSNNSQNAVETYLEIHNLRQEVGLVAARTSPDTSLLKPSPYLVVRVVDALSIHPSLCTLVGDSISDIQAAQAAGVLAIAYANNPDKVERLVATEPQATITRMSLLLAQLKM